MFILHFTVQWISAQKGAEKTDLYRHFEPKNISNRKEIAER